MIIIGAGINGLAAANYLRRAGLGVTVLERKSRVGGACSVSAFTYRGKKCSYPNGASVLGFMQDFVYRETGLSKRLRLHAPSHPYMAWLGEDEHPCLLHDDISRLTAELRHRFGERGRVGAFERDKERVVAFLREGYRNAEPPELAAAEKRLGKSLTRLWITGSARDLLDHYFTSAQVKLFHSVSVTESGPVALDSPYSAFSIPLMASGSIFGGGWGFVKGGIWTVADELGTINKSLGVSTICSATVLKVEPEDGTVTWQRAGRTHSEKASTIVFATDPLSAARLVDDRQLVRTVSRKKMLGTSGKLVLAFKKPVRWKNPTGHKDFDTALRFITAVPSIEALEESFRKIQSGGVDYAPGYYEIYCEGAADRNMGGKRPFEIVSVFFKNLSLHKNGKALTKVRKDVERLVLGKIANPQDLIKSILLTPKDLRDLFYFPQGNIDHVELCAGQTFCGRTYAADPSKGFYRFGRHRRVFYCGAGSYPAGSIAGTSGYMCAQHIIREARDRNRRA